MPNSEEQIATAQAMRDLTPSERDSLIAASTNVIDSRLIFEHRQHDVALARAYRKPRGRGIA